jgi:uncharacterized protein YndB with AHSA1/START domain
MMPVEQLSNIEKSVFIRAPRSRVWKALTTASEFAKWFRVATKDEFRVGARVNMESTYPGHEGKKFWLEVVEMEPERRFAWQWHPGDATQEDKPTQVVFTLDDVAGGTKVTVTESGFDGISLVRRAKAFESNTRGWGMQMENLRNYVEQAA